MQAIVGPHSCIYFTKATIVLYYLLPGSSAMASPGVEGCYPIRQYYIEPYYLIHPFLRYIKSHEGY